MRVLRVVLIGLLVLLGAAAVAAWLVPPRLDLNAYRGDIAALASARLGSEVTVGGPIELRLLPEPTLTAADISIASPGAGVNVTAAALRLRVAPGPLLSGHVDARELVLRGAELRLPWPLGPDAFMLRAPRWLTALSARVEDGRLLLGNVALTGIDATLTTEAYTGTYTTSGTARFSGRAWRFNLRLTQPGNDGSAGLDMTLDGLGTVQGVGGTLTGQIAPDGGFAGHLTARGPNLALLLPAPAVAFRAEGRVTVAAGLAAADDLAIEIGGSPARGAVALRVAPDARLDLALAASRLDLDAWLPVLVRPSASGLPTGIDLSAEAATFAGGTLRELRGAVDLSAGGVEVREAQAMLPGDAPLRLTGRVLPGTQGAPGPNFEGDVALEAPALRTTLAWVEKAGLGPLAALPPGVLHSASFAAHVVADPAQVAMGNMQGEVDGSRVSGSLTLRGGPHLALGAGLAVDRLELDRWLPAAADLAALPGWFEGLDVDLRLEAKQAVLHGISFAPLTLDASAEGKRVTVRKLDVQLNGMHATASATVAAGGRVTEGRLDVQAPQAEQLVALFPGRLAALSHRVPRLWRAAAAVQVLGTGTPDALALKVTADLGDLRLEAQPTLDLPHDAWATTMTLRHPGAPRLLEAFGMTSAPAWLGDGSLGLIAQLSGAPGKLAAEHFELTAGGLHAIGTLQLDSTGRVPVLNGSIAAETVPVPLPYARALEPLPLAALAGWNATVKLRAGRVLGNLALALEQAAATLVLQDGVARIDNLTAKVGGGTLTAQASLDSQAPSPALAVQMDLADAVVSEPVFDLPLDLSGGKLSGHVALTAGGHSPAALLATLSGDIRLDAQAGTLSGVALAKVAGALEPDDVTAALSGGTTPFDALHLSARVTRGIAVIQSASLTAPAGSGTIGGMVDLPDQSADLRLSFRPSVPNAPLIGLSLSGALEAIRRTPELAALTRWRAEHASATP